MENDDMSDPERQTHWENVYQIKAERDVSWFEESPTISLDLIHATGVKPDVSIIDIGGGTSRLVDTLLDEGFKVITVLDISEKALAKNADDNSREKTIEKTILRVSLARMFSHSLARPIGDTRVALLR